MMQRGVAVVPIIAPTREHQLERELADCYAQLELKQAQLEQAHQALAANGAPAIPEQMVMCVGGALVGEADGWLWLQRGNGAMRRLWPATPEEVRGAKAMRDHVEREQAARDAIRRRHAS